MSDIQIQKKKSKEGRKIKSHEILTSKRMRQIHERRAEENL
jgi:plasmid replication initiation protein